MAERTESHGSESEEFWEENGGLKSGAYSGGEREIFFSDNLGSTSLAPDGGALLHSRENRESWSRVQGVLGRKWRVKDRGVHRGRGSDLS